MTRRFGFLGVLCATALLAACGGGGATDGGTDGANTDGTSDSRGGDVVDAGADTMADVPTDTGTDGGPTDIVSESPGDAADDVEDASSDVTTDSASDVPVDEASDAITDVAMDADPGDASDSAVDASTDAPFDVTADTDLDTGSDAPTDTGTDVVADSGTGTDSSVDAGTPSTILTMTVASDSLGDDRVGGGDNAIGADGTDDGSFEVTLDGPFANLILITTDASGAPADGQQWDTVVGTAAMPAGVGTGFTMGSETWVLGVWEGATRLSNADGSVMAIGPGRHTIRIYGNDSGYFDSGAYFRVIGVRADGSLSRGPVVMY